MSSERDDEIVQWVTTDGRVSLTDLAARFGVSEMTIRRDLDTLTTAGRLQRVRGGAVRLPSPGEDAEGSTAGLASARPPRRPVATPARDAAPRSVATASQPIQDHPSQDQADAPPAAGGPLQAPADPWQRAAAAATADLPAGTTVLLTGGPGALVLADHLARRAAELSIDNSPIAGGGAALTVVTTAIGPAAILAGAPGVRLIVLGGEVDAGGDELSGPSALSALADLHLDVALLVPTGLDARGVWAASSGVAQLVAAAASIAASGGSRVVAVVAPEALGRAGRVRAVALSAVDQVVVVAAPHEDPASTAARLQALRVASPRSPDIVAA